MKNQHYTIKAIGPWHTSKSHTKIGASMIIQLDAPISAEIDWPDKEYDETEATFPPYQERTVRYAASNITELMVSVDLNRGKVVSISPGIGAQITLPPGFTPVPPKGGPR